MLLPFLKEKKWPKLRAPLEEKSYGQSSSEKLEDHCIGELMDAVPSLDVGAFRKALEALVLNCFEEGNPDES